MKLFRIFIFAILASMFLSACQKVPSGNVGIKVDLLGGNKGVDIEELSPGRHWIGFNEELHLFPTFTQNYTWTKEPTPDSPTDESLTFQTSQGLVVSGDIGISYRIDPKKASLVFQKYRKGVNEITDIYLRNMVSHALVSRASNLDVESVYGNGKEKLLKDVQSDVSAQVKDIGIIIENLYWVGNLRLPASVVASIDAKIAATQKAQQRENEIRQSEAEAAKKVADAKGQADSILMVAEAQAKANRLLSDSITTNLVQYKALETWDGKLPTTTGGAVPFINIK